jgi:hypothetical protein
VGAVQKNILNEMKYNTYVSLLSSDSPKNPQNTTGYHDKTPTSQNKSEISTITVNFAKISQDKPNFTAQTSLYPAQKISIITASNDRSLNDQKGGQADA